MFRNFVLAFLVSGGALAAQEPDATAILRQVAQTYKGLKSQKVDATVVLDMKANPMRVEIPVTGAMVSPGKIRLEVNNSMIGSQTISDGRNTWKYVPRYKQYTKKPTAPGIFPMSEGPGSILAGETVLEHLQTARVLRRETLSVDGKDAVCDVIEAEYASKAGDPTRPEGPKTLWVDRDRRLILKSSVSVRTDSSPSGRLLDMTQIVTVTSIQLNQPLPDVLFVFVPPEGTKEVDEFLPIQASASQGGR